MKRALILATLLMAPLPALADYLVATRTIRAKSVLTPDDLALNPGDMPGAIASPADAVGLETRATLYAGRPISSNDLGAPAIVERNQFLPLVYRNAGLEIRVEGRALDRAGVGDTIRVMNASSRTTVNARLAADGAAYVMQ
ncbi:flagellar basal body P-ring formation chaperone FlgA [Thioclava sp. 15-R06ZXC-3]|uniref:Flagella basal body P-ring formation protein FlgA n=1 Tax=Thioclava arctica TaxID=3238301 RepID=A0ABV3TI15_9RHOB